MSGKQSFQAAARRLTGGSIFVPVPFDPDEAWGAKPRHHVTGLVGGCKVRGALSREGDVHGLRLGPAWVRDNPLTGKTVAVTLMPEGPQCEALEPDIVAALAVSPAAASFFAGLATFYRTAFLSWIAGAKKRPDERVRRIAEMVRLLEAGKKQRPG